MFYSLRLIAVCLFVCSSSLFGAEAGLLSLCKHEMYGPLAYFPVHPNDPLTKEEVYDFVPKLRSILDNAPSCNVETCRWMSDEEWIGNILKKIVSDNAYVRMIRVIDGKSFDTDDESFDTSVYSPLVQVFVDRAPKALNNAVAADLARLGLVSRSVALRDADVDAAL